MGSSREVGFEVGVSEGRVPAGGEGRAGTEVAGVGLEESLGAGTGNEAGAKVGVEKSTPDKVGAVEGGGGARSSGVGDRREKSGVFEGEEGIGKVGEGLADTRETSGGDENVKAAIVVNGGGEIEPTSAVSGPGLAGERRVKGNDKLAGRVDGVGGEVKGHTVETMVGREGRVEGPFTHAVKGELGLWDQVVPAVRGESDVGGREDGNDMVLGGTYSTFRRVRAMVEGRDILVGDVDGDEERSQVRRSLVVKMDVGERVRERAEERDNRLEGGDVGGGGAGLHRVQVNVPVMQDHEEILVACRRSDREAPGQIGGSPLGSVEGEGVTVERGVKGIGGDRGKSRDEGSVWGGSLFAFICSCLSDLGGGGHARGVRRGRGRREKGACMPKKGGATRIEGLAAEGIKGEAEQSLVRHTFEEIGREAG